MKQRTRITAKMEQKMQELRAQGKSAKEIAAVIGVSATAVKKPYSGDYCSGRRKTDSGRGCAQDVR